MGLKARIVGLKARIVGLKARIVGLYHKSGILLIYVYLVKVG